MRESCTLAANIQIQCQTPQKRSPASNQPLKVLKQVLLQILLTTLVYLLWKTQKTVLLPTWFCHELCLHWLTNIFMSWFLFDCILLLKNVECRISACLIHITQPTVHASLISDCNIFFNHMFLMQINANVVHVCCETGQFTIFINYVVNYYVLFFSSTRHLVTTLQSWGRINSSSHSFFFKMSPCTCSSMLWINL